MKVILLTKPDARGDRAEATIRAIFANSSFVIEVLRIEFGKKKPLEHDFQCDWLISYVCPWVIPQRVLQQARHNVNFHPGPPDYPGTGCYNFALYNGDTQYGVTAHEMKPKVDSGTIYAVRRFPILPDDSVDTLQDRADGIMFGLFEETLRKIAGGTNPVAADPPEQWHPTKKATTSKDLDRLRVIPLNADDYEVARRARAMAHRRYPTGGACVELHGCRFYIPFEDAMRCDAKHVAHMDPNKAHEPRHRRIQPVHNLGEKKISPFEIEEAMMRISWQESDTWVVERSSDRLVIRPGSSAAPESLSTVDTVLDAVLGAIAATNRSSPDPDTPIFAQGINSATLVRLMSELQELAGAGVTLNPALLLADPMTPRKLAQLLLSGSGSATTPPSTSLQVMLQDVRAAQSELREAITSSRAVGVLHQDSAAAAAAHAPPPPKYAIIGGGGHASEVIMEIRREGRCEVVGVFDDNPASHGTLLEGVKVVGDSASVPADADVLICIGQNEVQDCREAARTRRSRRAILAARRVHCGRERLGWRWHLYCARLLHWAARKGGQALHNQRLCEHRPRCRRRGLRVCWRRRDARRLQRNWGGSDSRNGGDCRAQGARGPMVDRDDQLGGRRRRTRFHRLRRRARRELRAHRADESWVA